MKKINFLIKLAKEGKLKAVYPSEEVREAYRQRSEESLSSSKMLLTHGNLKDSVALAYYAMYHQLLAALFRIGIKCENHTASIILLQEVFGVNNEDIKKAKSERVDKQYYVDFQVTQEEVTQTIAIAEKFIGELHNTLATLNEKTIKEFHQQAILLFTEEEREEASTSK